MRATRDWVLFHRRRTKVCGLDVPPPQVAPRRYRLFHVQLPNQADREELRQTLEAGGAVARFKPQAAGMRLSGLTYTVTWNADQNQTSTTKVSDGSGQMTLVTRANTVSVTVNYTWNTGVFGNIPVRSTYVMQMSY